MIGEGGSGGALALGVADRVLMESSKPHLKYADTNAYGFAIMSVDGQKAEAEFIELDDPQNPTAKLLGRKKFVTAVGTNLVKPA